MVLIALETIHSNHIYQCGNTLYRQKSGGGIGAGIMVVVARIIMDIWDDKIHDILEENQILVYLLAK